MACPECEIAARRAEVRGMRAIARGAFVVHPKAEEPAVPGWWVVAPARHVEQVDALTPDEQSSLGPLVAEVSAALRAATPTAKIYVSIYAEVLAHLHVHVIARPPDLPAEDRGARIFLRAGAADSRAVDAAVAARLSGTAR